MCRTLLLGVVLLSCAAACPAQDAEIGIATGYGEYRYGSVLSSDGTAKAGFKNRFVVSAVITEDQTDHIPGEFRYLSQDGDPFIRAGGSRDAAAGPIARFLLQRAGHFN